MNYFFVHFENVNSDGIKDLSGVKEGDEFIIFYSEKCKSISIEIIEKILRMKVNLKCFKIKNGAKNALDFQLSSYLGFAIGQVEKDSNFFIVSEDRDYDSVLDFWRKQGVKISRTVLKKNNRQSVRKKPKENVTENTDNAENNI